MYSCKILADSLSPDHVRLTTFEVVFPRFLLAEFNTHRMLSRNSASSRAIPTEKLIERVGTDPFIPEFNQRVTGMGVGEPLPFPEALDAEDAWLSSWRASLKAADSLLHVDKSRVNRLLEPFMWHTALVTASDWGNFFALRNHEAAQPEFQRIASMMQEAYEANQPWHTPYDCWHLPLITADELPKVSLDPYYWKQVSAGRCARVSYLTHDGVRDTAQDIGLHNKLLASRHLSPFEHPARPFTDREWQLIREEQAELRDLYADHEPEVIDQMCRQLEYCGNFRGWRQYRQEIENQHDFSLARVA